MIDEKLMSKIDSIFSNSFGTTSLKDRQDDVFKEAHEFRNAMTVRSMKEELGHLLTSVLQGANEIGVDPIDLVNETLKEIESRSIHYKSLGRKINVGIMGGAFDPITNGHIGLAKHVLNQSNGKIDEIWIMPAFRHLFGKPMQSAEHRLEMCRLAVANSDKRIKVSDYEIKRELRGETYHLFKLLLAEEFAKREYNFSMIIGQDNANTINRWSNYESLIKMVPFIVCGRIGIDVDYSNPWYFKEPHMYLAQHLAQHLKQTEDLVEISSTMVRNAIKTGTAINGMVDDSVAEYIEKNGLYL